MSRLRSGALAFVLVVTMLAAVSGTGAFSAATADRPAEIVLAPDDRAYLGLAPHDGPNGAFATDGDRDGVLELALAGGAVGVRGTGPNADAVTRLDAVFDVTNQGTGPIDVWLEDGGVAAVTFYRSDDGGGSIETARSAVRLQPGETATVGVDIDADGEGAGTTLLSRVTVHADGEVGA